MCSCATLCPQVVLAVKTEAEAIQVAEAFETVSEAAKTLTSAKEDASATLGVVAQAAAALQGLANTTAGSEGHDEGGGLAGRGQERDAGRMWEKDKAAESSALALGAIRVWCRDQIVALRCVASSLVPCQCLQPVCTHDSQAQRYARCFADTRCICTGAVNANLMELKRRVNSTLQGMLTVTTNLEIARTRLERKQEEAVSPYDPKPHAWKPQNICWSVVSPKYRC